MDIHGIWVEGYCNEIWITRGSQQRNMFLQASHEKEQRAKETIHNLKAAGQVVN